MVINLNKLKKKSVIKFEELLQEAFKKKELPKDVFTIDEDLEAVVGFMKKLYVKNPQVLKVLIDANVVTEEIATTKSELLTSFERAIKNIAIQEQISKLFGEENVEKGYIRVKKYVWAISDGKPISERTKLSFAAKEIFLSIRKRLLSRIGHIKKSPKVEQLAHKYPDLPIQNIVAIGIMLNKLAITHDDLDWLDIVIQIVRQK